MTDHNGAKVEKLITIEVESKKKPGLSVKQQVHVYYTTQSLMVQRHRLIAGVKAYKVFVEDFLQPQIRAVMELQKDQVSETKTKLNDASYVKEEKKSSTEKGTFDCNMCEGTFKRQDTLKDHMCEIHKENKMFDCDRCDELFENADYLTTHKRTKHEHQGSVLNGGQLALEYKPNNIKCNICKEQFKSEDLSAHITKVITWNPKIQSLTH